MNVLGNERPTNPGDTAASSSQEVLVEVLTPGPLGAMHRTLREREEAAVGSCQVFLVKHPQRGTWFLCLMPLVPVDGAQRDALGPLIPLPLVGVPFNQVVMDPGGTQKKSASRFQYILVITDYDTRYPGAIPLYTTKVFAITDELMKVFARVGIIMFPTASHWCFHVKLLQDLNVTQMFAVFWECW